MLKSECIYTVLARAYTTQVLNPWHLQKKFGSPQWPIAQYEFRVWITRRIRKKFCKVNRRRQKSHATVPLREYYLPTVYVKNWREIEFTTIRMKFPPKTALSTKFLGNFYSISLFKGLNKIKSLKCKKQFRALFKGTVRRDVRGVENRLKRSVLTNSKTASLYFGILNRHHHKRIKKPVSTS
jgi:hypothetical protein